ncbi:hypothetical protein ACFSCV_01525 [Methylopila henanensis]|uniref:DUF4304 domain-containing protein n=1 Tax=Methylopila henanensis TaxID=873516 RepID=A0ABW4K2L1_9HYPH
MSAALRDRVRAACIEALKRHGFVEIRKGWPSKYINDDFSCWVGLNTGVYAGSVSLSPFVGVHAQKLDRRIAQFCADKKLKYDCRNASYAIHMGEIAPYEPVFDFFDGDDISEDAARLAKLYAEVGFPFSQSIASNEALLPLLYERVDMLGGYPERYAVCLDELGRRNEAIAYVTKIGEEWEHLRPFCQNFLEFYRTTTS